MGHDFERRTVDPKSTLMGVGRSESAEPLTLVVAEAISPTTMRAIETIDGVAADCIFENEQNKRKLYSSIVHGNGASIALSAVH